MMHLGYLGERRGVRRSGLTLMLVAVLAGCAQPPVRTQPAPVSGPAQTASPPVQGPAPTPPVAPTSVVVPPPTVATSLPAAASALAATAQAQRRAGDYARAAASLERALGISPHSAELWHQLAAVRLAAGEPEQAAQLAARSNALAGDDPDLKARNQAILEAARGR